MGNLIVLSVIGAAVLLAVGSIRADARKGGCAGCSGNCHGCTRCK